MVIPPIFARASILKDTYNCGPIELCISGLDRLILTNVFNNIFRIYCECLVVRYVRLREIEISSRKIRYYYCNTRNRVATFRV